MHRRSVSYTLIRWKFQRKKDNYLPLDKCYSANLVDHFYAFCLHLKNNPIVNSKKGHFTTVTEVQGAGNGVLVTIESGRFGEPGNTWDVKKNQISHKRKEDDAAATKSRLLFVAPTGSKVGLFASESVAGICGGVHVIQAFHKALGERWGSDFWPLDRVYETNDWLALTDLKQLTAVYYKWKRNLNDALDSMPTIYGRMERSIYPESEGGSLPKALWQAVRDHKLKASDVIGVEPDEDDDREPDEWFALVQKGTRVKKVEMGNEKVPTVRIVISDNGEPAPDDPGFAKLCIDEAAEIYFEAANTELNLSVLSGKWDHERLSRTWSVNNGQPVDHAEDVEDLLPSHV